MAVSHAKSDTIADWTGTVTVGNSAGGTNTVAATDLVRPADWNSAHNQFYTLSGNTNNASTASGTNVVLAGSGGVTLDGSTATIVIRGPLLSSYEPQPLHGASTNTVAMGANTRVTLVWSTMELGSHRQVAGRVYRTAANGSVFYFFGHVVID